MTVYEALVQAQHDACEEIDTFAMVAEPLYSVYGEYFRTDKMRIQSAIDRAYLFSVAIDNLPADVASREV